MGSLTPVQQPRLLLSTDDVREYVGARSYLSERIDASTLVAEEVGDGNLNRVLVCHDDDGRGVCLKQSLPNVRLVGEAWPLTQERTTAEARWYEAVTGIAPDLAAGYYGFDEANHVLALEDLSRSLIWRKALISGEPVPEAAVAMGRLVAEMSFRTSWMALGIPEARRRAASHANAELCEITEDLVFTEPFIDHPHNSVAPCLQETVKRLRGDEELRCAVETLKSRFAEHAEALIHGDLHTGSVMVGGTGAGITAKAIDGEFCCYGPVGFDIGMLFANCLFAEARAAVLGLTGLFAAVGELRRLTWDSFATEMRRLWQRTPPEGWSASFLERWLARVATESVGFAGCEAVRRVVGLAKVADLESLPEDAYAAAGRATLEIATRWIGLFLDRSELPGGGVGRVVERANELLAERLGSAGP